MTTSTPAAGARIGAQARYEATTLLSNGEQLLVSLVLPAMALVGLAISSQPSLGSGRRIDIVVPGVLALAVVSTAFTGQAIATGFDRRYGVLRWFGTTPLGQGGLLAGKALAVLVVVAVQTVVLCALGLAFGWRPTLVGIPGAILLMVLGTWTWVALALLLAGTLRAEAVLAVANLIWVLVAGLGGVVIPTSRMGVVGDIVRWLPSGALGDGLRDLFTGHDATLWQPVLTLVIWATVASLAARRFFRWGD